MQSNTNPKVVVSYYIVCRPIGFSNHLDNEGIVAIFNEVKNNLCKDGRIYNVFLDKEQAMLAASQFAAREVPTFFSDKQYAKTHDFAKPILCLTPEQAINLTDKSESCYFINGKKTVCTAYQTSVNELQQWQDSNWTLLIDGKEYLQPDKGQQPKNVASQIKCSLM